MLFRSSFSCNIIARVPRLVVDYVVVVDDVTLEPVEKMDSSALLAIAVELESIRLIDNSVLRLG